MWLKIPSEGHLVKKLLILLVSNIPRKNSQKKNAQLSVDHANVYQVYFFMLYIFTDHARFNNMSVQNTIKTSLKMLWEYSLLILKGLIRF